MIKKILVPLDGSDMSIEALRFTLDHHPDAEVTVLHVVGQPSPYMGKAMSIAIEGNTREVAEERAEEVFSSAESIAEEYERDRDGSHGGTGIRTDTPYS
ncbi:MAG: universal stress protein [Halobacteria archaeon]